MKNRLLILLLLNLLSNMIYCQRFYVCGGSGYGFNTMGNDDLENKIYGFGSLGFNLSNKFDIEFSINSFSYGYNFLYPFDNRNINFQITRINSIIKYNFSKSTNSFYLKLGPSIGIGGNMFTNFVIYNDGPPFDSGGFKIKFSGGIAPGGIFAFGKEFILHQDKLFHVLSLFIEFISLGNEWIPGRETIYESFGIHPNPFPSQYHFFITEAIQMGLKYRF